MITPSEEYKKQLWHFQYNTHSVNYNFQMPENEPVYQIDLNTRKVIVPNNLGVVEDHQAERIFFEINRDCNGIDLAKTVCVIIFKNAKKEGYTYVVPEYILDENSDKMLFSWLLQAPLTAYAGKIQFMIKFFLVNKDTQAIEFELNTQVCESTITASWAHTITEESSQYELLLDPSLLDLFNAMQTAVQQGYFDVYWTDL